MSTTALGVAPQLLEKYWGILQQSEQWWLPNVESYLGRFKMFWVEWTSSPTGIWLSTPRPWSEVSPKFDSAWSTENTVQQATICASWSTWSGFGCREPTVKPAASWAKALQTSGGVPPPGMVIWFGFKKMDGSILSWQYGSISIHVSKPTWIGVGWKKTRHYPDVWSCLVTLGAPRKSKCLDMATWCKFDFYLFTSCVYGFRALALGLLLLVSWGLARPWPISAMTHDAMASSRRSGMFLTKWLP